MYLAELKKLLAQLKKYRGTCEQYSRQTELTDALMHHVANDIAQLERDQSKEDVEELSKRLRKKDRATLAAALRLAGTR